MRLFTAINFNDSIKEKLTDAINNIRDLGVEGRFSYSDNLHLTLVFIGETERISDAQSITDSIRFNPFQMTINGIGRFKRDKGDILWTGIEADQVLYTMQADLMKKLSRAGFNIDKRKYKPHLTIGRQVHIPSDVKMFELSKLVPEITVNVSSISLMKSERIDGKLTYTDISL